MPSPNLLVFLLIFILTPFNFGPCCGSDGHICPETEKQALLQFKLSVNDPGGLLSTWRPQVDCCRWEHVVCNNLTGHVLELHLQNPNQWWIPEMVGNAVMLPVGPDFSSGLNGRLDHSILMNLTHLRYLDLSRNYFEGQIPAFIGSFRHLEYIDLSHAGFNGSIPHIIGNLSSLHTLALAQGYQMRGESFESGFFLPLEADSLEWLSGLSHLEYLDLSYVNMSRVVNWVQVMNALPSLAELHLQNALPDSFVPLDEVNFPSLTILDLSSNYQHDFPSWILHLPKLTHLDLSWNLYSNTVPSSSSNLPKLRCLEWSFSNLISVPDWLYNCTSLEYISMSFNHLQGSISSSIGNLTSLTGLDLYHNMLSGEIPSEITKLCNISYLNLTENQLQGEISDTFRNMSRCFSGSLKDLNLRNNNLSGHLPDQLGDFLSLQTLDLGHNLLSGPIPDNLRKLLSLETLGLDHNKFSGNIPDSIGQLSKLKSFLLSDNMLEGFVLENHFANLTNLDTFKASRNNLTLKVSSNWVPTFRVSTLELQSWNLDSGGEIPSWLQMQKKHIQQLDLSNTGIAHQFASWFWEIPILNLSHNQLHGEIPDSISPGTEDGPRLVYLSNNHFNGSLPRIGSGVTELDLSNNLFSGGSHHFICDESKENFLLEIMNVGKNLLSGEIPHCWNKWPLLRVLNLGNNYLSGHIPTSIDLLTNLLSLDLYNNKLSGQIPSLRNCSLLSKIDVAYNQLTGNLPVPLGVHLPNLGILILRSNNLSGQISSDICGFRSLQILDFSNNMFSGTIPSCVDNFIPMASKQWFLDSPDRKWKYYYTTYRGGSFIESANVATKGSKFQYDTILSYVTSFDISNNNLSGQIPEELTRLSELRSLSLSGNDLRGMIPHGIGDMKELESVDLSRNSLSGEIPDTLAVLTNLNHLNVSYNNLTGRIPQSTQIMGLPQSGFFGNKLCGPPLTMTCNNANEKTGSREDEEQDKDGKSEVEWLYVISALGYGLGLAFICNVLIFKKSFRVAFFESVDNMWNKLCVYCSIKINRCT